MIADLIASQDDLELMQTIDYIKNPKSNGYRSLHLIVTVPVFLRKGTERVKVEIQIRTIAMDYWATVEHQLAYKIGRDCSSEISAELKACADETANIEIRIQKLFDKLNG